MGVCGTPWQIVDAADVRQRIAHRIPGSGPRRAEVLAECGDELFLESPDGVLVVTLIPDDRGLEFVLFVLLAVGYLPGACMRREPDLDILAADLGASSIAMRPARRGWARLLGPDWIGQGDVFTRRVLDGRQAVRGQANGPAACTG